MSLPNYAPSGTIRFGCVPWSNDYGNVRLYSSLSEQNADIASMMLVSSGDYTYLARNRTIKVSIEADRLYHCNYCMYLNTSVTGGWIYAFVTDVRYVNDNTSEVVIETDVFQTFLYGVDWTVPPCYIERETVPSEDMRYMLTNEPDFPLIYVVDDHSDYWFDVSGIVIQTANNVETNSSIIDNIMNPSGAYATDMPAKVYKGVCMGANYLFFPLNNTPPITEGIETYLYKMNQAGATDSIVSIFTVPNVLAQDIISKSNETAMDLYQLDNNSWPDSPFTAQATFNAPSKGSSVDGYTPRNGKLLYYPYTLCRLTDYNGSKSDMRYELMDSLEINVKCSASPECKGYVFPQSYMGIPNFDVGIVVQTGSLGSWVNDSYQSWVAQNSGTIALSLAGVVVGGLVGGIGAGLAARALTPIARAGMNRIAGSGLSKAASSYAGTSAMGAGIQMAATGIGATVGMASSGGLDLMAQSTNAAHQPDMTRGQATPDVLTMGGMLGAHAQKVCVKAEVAEQIDVFFDRYGYEVDRIETVNISSRERWNFVKTVGSVARSTNSAAGTAAPFARGAGTPPDALALIGQCFDQGITFWHTTSGFGDFSQSNSIV